jgi:hypothetical protein
MYLQRLGPGDVSAKLPEATPLEGWDASTNGTLICAVGFEDRTSAVAQFLARKDRLSGLSVLLVKYPTNMEDNAVHEGDFVEAAKKSRGLRRLNYGRQTFADDLSQTLDELAAPGSRAIIDMSTMSSYLFYPILFALLDRELELSIAYSEAEQYFPLKEEWEKVAERARAEGQLFVRSFEDAAFQSDGLGEVYSFAPYYEYNYGSRPTALVCLPNFSVVRMRAMCGRASELHGARRDLTHWVVGKPPGERNWWRMEAVRVTNNLENTPPERLHEASTLNYKEIIEVLDRIWDATRYTTAMSIACLGSKMQHLGVGLFCRMHKEISLWLSEPQKFSSKRFSSGCGAMWQLDFGGTKGLRALLESQGTYQWKLPDR